SLNYNGDPTNRKNLSARIPEDENCSLFLTGLPPNVTYAQLLALFRQTGRIYATFINPPEFHRGHPTCAAKVTFFSKRAAQEVLRRHGPGRPRHAWLSTRGYKIKVVPHRVKVSEPLAKSANWEDDYGGPPSRVLAVSGPREIVRVPTILKRMRRSCYFNLDQVVVIADTEEYCALEIRFASFYGQAQLAFFGLCGDIEFQGRGGKVSYGADPCGE
ncbi:hypothetical protein B0T14DRAFT_415084, partial [Immersiella caudata]